MYSKTLNSKSRKPSGGRSDALGAFVGFSCDHKFRAVVGSTSLTRVSISLVTSARRAFASSALWSAITFGSFAARALASAVSSALRPWPVPCPTEASVPEPSPRSAASNTSVDAFWSNASVCCILVSFSRCFTWSGLTL